MTEIDPTGRTLHIRLAGATDERETPSDVLEALDTVGERPNGYGWASTPRTSTPTSKRGF